VKKEGAREGEEEESKSDERMTFLLRQELRRKGDGRFCMFAKENSSCLSYATHNEVRFLNSQGNRDSIRQCTPW
jgi:hypothetical protein